MSHPKTIAIDFDGVLSDYRGWRGEHELDPPLAGAIEWLQSLVRGGGYEVVIHTTRDAADIFKWLATYATPELVKAIGITNRKPPAWVYIEDRAILFKGPPYPTPEQIDAFRAWWQI